MRSSSDVERARRSRRVTTTTSSARSSLSRRSSTGAFPRPSPAENSGLCATPVPNRTFATPYVSRPFLSHARSVFERQGEVHVLALVPQRDPCATVRPEAGHFLPRSSRHGADQGDPDHLRIHPPGRRHRISAAAELAIATQERMIALRDAAFGERVILFVMDPSHAHARGSTAHFRSHRALAR